MGIQHKGKKNKQIYGKSSSVTIGTWVGVGGFTMKSFGDNIRYGRNAFMKAVRNFVLIQIR